MSDDAKACKHARIQTWRFEDSGEASGLWSCIDCGRKFEPVAAAQPPAALHTAIRLVLDATPEQLPLALDALRDFWACAPGAQPPAAMAVPPVDDLAQHIRRLDGSNKMGAGVLAEKLVEWLQSRTTPQAQSVPATGAQPQGATLDDMNTLIGHAFALRMSGQTDMPAYFFDLAERIAPDAEHARRVRELAVASPTAPTGSAG